MSTIEQRVQAGAAWLDEVWDILVKHAGAYEPDREDFKQLWPDCREYRFSGSLGFGGKIWANRHPFHPYVNCYPENLTSERKAIIEKTNTALRGITLL